MISRRLILILVLIACLGCWLVLFFAERSFRDPSGYSNFEENYSKIEENLYMGGHVPAPPTGTQAVLNLCETEDQFRCEIEEWAPIRDSAPAPEIDWLRKRVEWIEAQQLAGKPTFVHCFAGVSRSGMVVAAYLMRKNDWTRDQAIEFIRTKRPQIRPNPAFMDRLLEWEEARKLKSK